MNIFYVGPRFCRKTAFLYKKCLNTGKQEAQHAKGSELAGHPAVKDLSHQ